MEKIEIIFKHKGKIKRILNKYLKHPLAGGNLIVYLCDDKLLYKPISVENSNVINLKRLKKTDFPYLYLEVYNYHVEVKNKERKFKWY